MSTEKSVCPQLCRCNERGELCNHCEGHMIDGIYDACHACPKGSVDRGHYLEMDFDGQRWCAECQHEAYDPPAPSGAITDPEREALWLDGFLSGPGAGYY